MKHRLRATALLAGTAMAVAFGAGSASAQQAVKIGMFTPLTGASSVVGLDMQRGVELAIARINAGFDVPMQDGTTLTVGPGLLGAPINLIVEDDESRPQAAMDAARKLVEVDGVAVLIGEYSSGRTQPVGQYANENQVVHISIGANAESLRDIGPYFFDAIALAGLQGPQLIAMAQAAIGDVDTFGTIFPNNPYGVGMEIATCAAAAAIGIECVSTIRYEEQKTDYRPELNQLTAPQPDAVAFFAYGADATLILRQAFELGVDAAGTWFGAEVSNWVADVAAIPEVAEGIRGVEHAVAGELYETQYRAAYVDAYGEEPLTVFGAFGYDAAMLAALAINAAGSTDSDAIRQAMHEVSQTYLGITGNLAFDEDGMRMFQDYGEFIYTNGELVPYVAE
ncbi:MAG: ABC transporter substrate-binding protein [Bauldia sp.]|nr:ABC transporter substrate-binding protein [Bauldia sp.]